MTHWSINNANKLIPLNKLFGYGARDKDREDGSKDSDEESIKKHNSIPDFELIDNDNDNNDKRETKERAKKRFTVPEQINFRIGNKSPVKKEAPLKLNDKTPIVTNQNPSLNVIQENENNSDLNEDE